MSNRIKPPKGNQPLSFADIITFGKYKGYTVAQVLDPEFVNDPSYILWANDDLDFVPWFKVTPAVYSEAEEAASIIEERKRIEAQAHVDGYGPDEVSYPESGLGEWDPFGD